jgi:hypothetical protein
MLFAVILLLLAQLVILSVAGALFTEIEQLPCRKQYDYIIIGGALGCIYKSFFIKLIGL